MCLKASKNYNTTLAFSLRQLDKMYDDCLHEVQVIVNREPIMTLVLDDYNKVIQTQVQRGNKSTIIHRATASSVVHHKMTLLPVSSIIVSPTGINYQVKNVCREIPYVYCYLWVVPMSKMRHLLMKTIPKYCVLVQLLKARFLLFMRGTMFLTIGSCG